MLLPLCGRDSSCACVYKSQLLAGIRTLLSPPPLVKPALFPHTRLFTREKGLLTHSNYLRKVYMCLHVFTVQRACVNKQTQRCCGVRVVLGFGFRETEL